MKHNTIDNFLVQQPPLYGLVLCGGKSSRMGSDKSEIQYHNKSQRQYLFDLLSMYCKQTFISCNKKQSKQINDLPLIEDAYDNIGPLGGIMSAFKKSPASAWLIVACDLPFVNEANIQQLISHRNKNKMATAFWNVNSKSPEPMITVWEPLIHTTLLEQMQQGVTSPRKILLQADVAIVQVPDELILKNVNTIPERDEVFAVLNK